MFNILQFQCICSPLHHTLMIPPQLHILEMTVWPSDFLYYCTPWGWTSESRYT